MSYPFVKCLNPRVILNPYTKERLVVPCGSCPACSLRRSSMNAMKCKLESLSHKYTMFITLTYNNASLPKMSVRAYNRFKDECGEICDTYEAFRCVDITTRTDEVGIFLGHCDNGPLLFQLAKKVELPPFILPRLLKKDAQLFIKRLRRNIERFYDNHNKIQRLYNYEPLETPKIRYYLVGEYGPRHFRPHYHLKLWFSDDFLYKNIRQILHQSWKFGRIDCQKSQGNSADYVAKYLNSNMSLPSVFSFQQTRPFSIHSSHLGEKVFEMPREEIYQNEYKTIISRCIPSISTDSDIFLWRSLKTYYFPKCKGYSQKSEYERLYSYTTFIKARDWLKTDSVIAQAREILAYCFGVLCHDNKFMRRDTLLIDYFIKSAGICMSDKDDWEHSFNNSDLYLRAIYMELRLSRHFYRFVCKEDVNLIPVMLKKIYKFWNDDDLNNINGQYKNMEEFLDSEYFSDYEELKYNYVNLGFDVEEFKNSVAFRRFKQAQIRNSENAVKHKILNDANRIFCDNRRFY